MNENNYTETNLQEIETQIAKLTEQKNKIAQELLNAKAKEQIGDIIGKLYFNKAYANNCTTKAYAIFTKVISKTDYTFFYEGIYINVDLNRVAINKCESRMFSDKEDFDEFYEAIPLSPDLAFIANAFTNLISDNK